MPQEVDHNEKNEKRQGFMNYTLVIIAVMAVAVADALLKRAGQTGNFLKALQTPWVLGAVLLYVLQVVIFTLVFVRGWKLSIVGNLQTIFYILTVVAAGLIFFHERLTPTQWTGVGLAAIAVWLLSR